MENRFLKLVNEKNFIDNTDVIEDILHEHHNVISNMEHTGGSVLIDMLEAFLSKEYEDTDAFKNLKILEWDQANEYLHKYAVIKLDFSDFNATDYEGAINYFKDKMAVTYLKNNKYFILDTIEKRPSETKEWMQIVKRDADERTLEYSLKNIFFKIRWWRFEGRIHRALLIDNLVRVEVLSKKYGYYDQMKEFLKEFIVYDVYKHVECFLQIGNAENIRSKAIDCYFCKEYLSYTYFTVWDRDIKKTALHNRLIYDEHYQGDGNRESSSYEFILDQYSDVIKNQEIMIEKAEKWYENDLIEQEKNKQACYLRELRSDFPRISKNLGIRMLPDLPKNEKYHELNSLLTEIYKINPQNDDDIYTYFQQIERDVPTDLMQHKEEYSKEFEDFNSCWNIGTEIYNHWVQIECCKGKDYCITGLTRVKAYISVNDPKINNMFITIIKNILSSAQKSFGIKAARYLRADTICVWISLEDLKLLENACLPYANHISRKLHFMPYKGNIAISKDLIGDVSYNYVIANMIETYLKSIKSVDEIDVFKMYDLFIDQWNRKPPYKDSMFVDMSAFTFMVILDSLEAILSGKDLTCNSSLFCQDDSVLAALERGHCWGDVKLRTGDKI